MRLLAVLVFAVIYYCGAYGASYGLHIVLLTACSVIAALCTDAVYFKATKRDIRRGILTSYSWVTAPILTLISRVSVSYYGMIVCTVIAVYSSASLCSAASVRVSSTRLHSVKQSSWQTSLVATVKTSLLPLRLTTVAQGIRLGRRIPLPSTAVSELIFLGQYASLIGSTSALLILLCCVFLIWRKDIDWQVPVTYIVTVFVESLIVGAITGSGAPGSYLQRAGWRCDVRGCLHGNRSCYFSGIDA